MEHMSMATTSIASRQAGPRLGQPVRGVIGGAALDLAQQPLIPGQVEETRVPAVREQHGTRRSAHRPASGAGRGGARRSPGAPPGQAACANTGSARSANAAWVTGQDTCCHRRRLGHGAAPLGDLRAQQPAQPAG